MAYLALSVDLALTGMHTSRISLQKALNAEHSILDAVHTLSLQASSSNA